MSGCGTVAGYHAHLRRGEDTCADCRAAMAEDKSLQRREERMKHAASFEQALELEPDVEATLDALSDAKDNLRIVRAAMRVAKSTRDISALSKQRDELVRNIKELEADRDKAGGVLGGLDAELANIIRPDFSEGRTGT